MQLDTYPTEPPRVARSAAQIEAARRNGARSRGPVTAEGRLRSARNALRHGLCSARTIVAPGEDPAEFEALLEGLRAEHGPRTPGEDLLVHRLAVTFWKLARCDRLQATLATIEPHCPTGRLFPDPGLPRLLSRVPELNTILRHEAQLDRQLHRLRKALAERGELGVESDPEACQEVVHSEPAPGGPAPPSEAGAREEIQRNEPEPAHPAARSEAGAREQIQPNEPEPARPAARSEAGAGGQIQRNEPEPGLLRAAPSLLERARSEPALARAIEVQLLANGDLAGFARACRALRPAQPAPQRAAAPQAESSA